jgi:hypothetical protein
MWRKASRTAGRTGRDVSRSRSRDGPRRRSCAAPPDHDLQGVRRRPSMSAFQAAGQLLLWANPGREPSVHLAQGRHRSGHQFVLPGSPKACQAVRKSCLFARPLLATSAGGRRHTPSAEKLKGPGAVVASGRIAFRSARMSAFTSPRDARWPSVSFGPLAITIMITSRFVTFCRLSKLFGRV